MSRRVARSAFVFDKAPLRVYWELTRACDLACRHCRAEAIPSRNPRELSLTEGRRFLEALREFGGGPRVVLTGGDPLKRPDFWDLLEHGVALGFDVSVAPSGTPALTGDAVRQLKRAGAQALSLSLDGSDPIRHDGFRGVPGCFGRTLEAGRVAVDEGIALQVNTLVTAETLTDLPAIAELVHRLGAGRWSLFFLIQVGRGRLLRQLGPALCECLLTWLWKRSRKASFGISTTEAPHYRRVALQQMRGERSRRDEIRRSPIRRGFGIRDGNGIMFVSHTGDVQPSGFLPLVAGNVRTASPVTAAREIETLVRERLAQAAPPSPDGSGPAAELTRRELEVLRLLTGGANTRTIADRLHVSPATVRNHVQNIFSKLGVHSRLEAAAYATRHRFL